MNPRLATLDRLFDAFNRHDADAVMSCFAPGAVFHTAAGPTPSGRKVEGHPAIRAAFSAVWHAMPDVRWSVHGSRVDGEHGIVEWLFTGTPRVGAAVEIEGVDLFTFAGDLVATKSAFRKDRTAA